MKHLLLIALLSVSHGCAPEAFSPTTSEINSMKLPFVVGDSVLILSGPYICSAGEVESVSGAYGEVLYCVQIVRGEGVGTTSMFKASSITKRGMLEDE